MWSTGTFSSIGFWLVRFLSAEIEPKLFEDLCLRGWRLAAELEYLFSPFVRLSSLVAIFCNNCDATSLTIGCAWWVALRHLWDDCLSRTVRWSERSPSSYPLHLDYERSGVAGALRHIYSAGDFVADAGGAHWRHSQNVSSSVLNPISGASVFCKDKRGTLWGYLNIDGRLSFPGLIRVVRSRCGMAGHCPAGGLLVKQKQKNRAPSIDVVGNEGWNDSGRVAVVVVKSPWYDALRGVKSKGWWVLARKFNPWRWILFIAVDTTASASNSPRRLSVQS